MSTQAIFAEQTVSITELRKNPNQYFQEEPVAVLANNKPAGYMISAALYEQMLQIIEQASPGVAAQFRPSKARMDAITHRGMELLKNASDAELGDFKE
jgi:antitoxin YafN